jgi:Flp pilus assembly protein protease CpaA
LDASAIIVLGVIGFTDLKTLKIQNSNIIILFALFAAHACVLRSGLEITLNVLLASVVFAASIFFYARKLIGGGDVKLLCVICLWVETRFALLFSIALLTFVGMHLSALKIGWIHNNSSGTPRTIPFGPALAAAAITVTLLGCV